MGTPEETEPDVPIHKPSPKDLHDMKAIRTKIARVEESIKELKEIKSKNGRGDVAAEKKKKKDKLKELEVGNTKSTEVQKNAKKLITLKKEICDLEDINMRLSQDIVILKTKMQKHDETEKGKLMTEIEGLVNKLKVEELLNKTLKDAEEELKILIEKGDLKEYLKDKVDNCKEPLEAILAALNEKKICDKKAFNQEFKTQKGDISLEEATKNILEKLVE